MKNELEFLNKIKEQLLSDGELIVDRLMGDYTLKISPERWHDIFKTDEYNKLKQK
jgi:hypothetical protein